MGLKNTTKDNLFLGQYSNPDTPDYDVSIHHLTAILCQLDVIRMVLTEIWISGVYDFTATSFAWSD